MSRAASTRQLLTQVLTRFSLRCLVWGAALAGCGGSGASAHATGTVAAQGFPVTAVRFEARSTQGEVSGVALGADGAFDVPLALERTWTFHVIDANGVEYPVALPRDGHYDRGLVSSGRVEARLGTVWLPPQSIDVTRVPEREGAQCVDGQKDGTPCAVLEALVSCADGPARPVEDPTSLLLGTGVLSDLPGTDRGVKYAVPSRVPPPILWECPPQQPY